MATIRSFLRYLTTEGFDFSPVLDQLERPKPEQDLPKILSKAQVNQLIAAPNPKSFLYDRDVAILELLDTDVFHVSIESCVSFLDPMIESWDMDLKSFGVEIVLNPRLTPGSLKRFEFVEVAAELAAVIEPGFEQFLKNKTLRGDANEEEIEFLKKLPFKARKPSALYYYRELQNLRDPLHFHASESSNRDVGLRFPLDSI